MANWLISRITKVRLRDYGCTLKAYRREVVRNIKLYGEMHRFIPAIASQIGVAIAEVPVNHRPRLHGTSKYKLTKSVRVFLDLLTVKFLLSYSTRPLQIFGLFGLISGGMGGVLGPRPFLPAPVPEAEHRQPAAPSPGHPPDGDRLPVRHRWACSARSWSGPTTRRSRSTSTRSARSSTPRTTNPVEPDAAP